MEKQPSYLSRRLPSTFEQRSLIAALCDDLHASSNLRLRAQIIHMSLQGIQSKSIARRLEINVLTVRKWRARFLELGIAGLNDSVRRREPMVSAA